MFSHCSICPSSVLSDASFTSATGTATAAAAAASKTVRRNLTLESQVRILSEKLQKMVDDTCSTTPLLRTSKFNGCKVTSLEVTLAYWASQQLVGRAFVCLLQELASQPSQPAVLPTAEARLATPGLFSEKSHPTSC